MMDEVETGMITSNSVNVQTELTMADLELRQMVEMNIVAAGRKQNDSPEGQQKCYPSMKAMKSDRLLRFYTGLSSFGVFLALHKFMAPKMESKSTKLSVYESFIMTLMKLRLNLSNFDLAYRFCVSQATVGRTINKWILAIDSQLSSSLIRWPDQEALRKTMPFCYRPSYGLNLTAIIDCFELYIEKPLGLLAKSCTWSTYKHYNTAKYLISITPQGTVSFISEAGEAGRASDKHITEHSGN